MGKSTVDHIALARRASSHLTKKSSERQLVDLQPFFDLLADDAVFKVSCSDDTPIFGGEISGKQAIIKLFTVADRESVENLEMVEPLEFIGSGDRVVALGVQTYTIKKTGVTVPNKEFATVFDFRDGLIVRVLSIEEMSEWTVAYRSDSRTSR